MFRKEKKKKGGDEQAASEGPVDGVNAQNYEVGTSSNYLDAPFEDGEDEVSRLYRILAEGVEQKTVQQALSSTDGKSALTSAENLARRETAEKTWNAVRKWLDEHPSAEDRAAATSIRGDGDQTPLHLICKGFDPPTDCVRALLECAHHVASWTEATSGWLPLHLACANTASPEVLSLLIQAYPEGKVAQDLRNRTPLHFCATSSSMKIESLMLLCDTEAASLTDTFGMLPIHYACAYGTGPEKLRVLAEAYPDGVVAKERNGRTPMHFAMSNASRNSSPGAIQFLVEMGGERSVNIRDNDGYLPLQLLVQGLQAKSSQYNANEEDNISECLGLYLAARPKASADFLQSLQDLPDWAQDVAVVSPHVREMLNKKIVRRFHTCILMLDGYFLIIIIVMFELVTSIAIGNRYGTNEDEKKPMDWGLLGTLFLGVFYFVSRELIQVISLISFGNISAWFQDFTNWLDMAVIIMVSYYGALMANDEWAAFDSDGEAFRAGLTLTKGVLWMAVIYYLKSTLVDFAVFVGGVFYVVERLIAFLLGVIVILFAFAQMFYFIYKEGDVCTLEFPNLSCDNITQADSTDFNGTHQFFFDEDGVLFVGNEDNDTWEETYNPCDCPTFPHCTFKDSFIKVYTMMMGEIGSETRYVTSDVAQILYLLYAFLVVILLSNVLIAIVTDLYEIIQNDRAAIVFWQNRLDFVAEMDGISYEIEKRFELLLCFCYEPEDRPNRNDPEAGEVDGFGSGDGNRPSSSADDKETADVRFFREGWNFFLSLFDADLYGELMYTDMEFYSYHFYRTVMLIFVPIWLLLGLATAGWLWPPQVREYLFDQQYSNISRAEMERKKLEQLKEIDGTVKSLKNDLVEDMAADREDFVRMKTDISSFQEDVFNDLVQINELMKTLLELGGNGHM